MRRYLLVNAALFLLFSAGCAFAHNLGQMIVLRALQGFCGGVLIPLAFTIIITRLPPRHTPAGLALFTVSATFAPAIGPTIGGWLTENLGWQYIFYVNLIPGGLMLVMLWLSLDSEPMQLGLLRKGDWAGVMTMAVGLAALQTVLEEGNKDDWFSSALIQRLSATAVIALGLFVWIELRSPEPLLNLRLLLRRNFGFGTLANFLLGLALYGAVYLLPVYLARVQGYNAEQIGAVMAWNGLPQLVLIPLVPRLMRRVDPRVLIAGGFAVFAASMFMNVGMTVDYAGPQFLRPNIVRAVGQAFVLTPLSAIATGGIEPENAASASALFNMTRNIGGAFGIALLQTFVTKREQFHSNVLSHAVSVFDLPTRLRLDALAGYFLAHGADPQTAQHKAIIAVGRAVQKQAFVMSFSDTFFLLGAALLVALAATLLLKRPASLAAGGH
jgi:DHA2 family multidrug resistance protein